MNSHTSATPPALRLLEKRVRSRALPTPPAPSRLAWWARWLNWAAVHHR